jgi:hypothetical protein
MSGLSPVRRLISLIFLSVLIGCQNVPLPSSSGPDIVSTVPSVIQIPFTIERLAIFYPETYDRRFLNAYLRLEGGTFQLKELRPSLKVVERFDLRRLLEEQRFQLSGAVSDETAVRLGRLLGVDGVALYRVEGPSNTDRVLARVLGGIPPVVVISKIIMIENAEVVFLNAVTVPVDITIDKALSYMDSQLQIALDRGVAQTIADLRHAFR